MEGIGNMARMQDGQMVVDFVDENGERQTKALEDLTQGNAEMILKAPQNEEDYMGSMLYEAQTTNQRLKNLNDSFELGFVEDIDVYQQLESSSVKSIKSLRDAVTTSLTNIKDTFDQTQLGEQMEKMFGMGAKFDEYMSRMIGSVEDFLSGSNIDINNVPNLEIDDVTGIFNVKSPNVTFDNGGGINSPNVTVTEGQTDYLSRESGQLVPFTQEDDVLGAKRGGPIDKLLDSAINGGRGGGNLGNGNITINGEIKVTGPTGAIASINASELKKMVINQINQTERNGGSTSGKQMVDNGSLNA